MLPTAHRLRRRRDFTATVRGGRRAGRRTLVVHLRRDADPDAAPTRVGFVVSRAVGGAVVRNRVRRRLRHLVREHIDQLPAGATVVVRALPPAAKASYAALRHDLLGALRSALPAGSRTRRAS